jgi:DNA-binding MarR family transcriptional regulator
LGELMSADLNRAKLIEALDASIAEFNRDGRLARKRATRRAHRLTGLDWTYSALMILEGVKDNATLRMSQLADSVGTTPPTVTKLVKDLEDRGLITRTPDEQDGRASILSLTEKGRQVAESIRQARLEGLQQVLTTWSSQDIAKLDQLFEQLRTDMRRMT